MSEKADITTLAREIASKTLVAGDTFGERHAERLNLQEAIEEAFRSAVASAEAAAQCEEKAHLATIDQRDAAEEFASQVYFKIVGESPQWSNLFGYEQALEDITDKFETLLSHVKDAASAEAAALERAAKKAAAYRRNDTDPIEAAKDRVATAIEADIRALIPPSHSPAPAGEAPQSTACLTGIAANEPCHPDDALKRCTLCGFIVDTKYAAEKPTVTAAKRWSQTEQSAPAGEAEVERLRAALDRSVRLQSHYAELLNTYDGGQRMQFASAEEWVKRLEEIGHGRD